MPLTIENIRVRIGLQPDDGSQDAEIAAALETATSIAEMYCNRKFQFSVDTEVFTHISGAIVSLRRYPVSQIISMQPHDVQYHLEKETGLLHIDGWIHLHELTVEYEGGYQAFPIDLEMAFLPIFDTVWAALKGGGSVQAGAIDSITVPDVGTVRFANTGSSSSSSGSNDFAGLPVNVLSILNLYRRELC